MTNAIKYWGICCNPDTYDGLGAASKLDKLCWTLDRGEPMPGDKIILWQAKGSKGRRGIIALGEVIAPPSMTEESPEEEEFWQVPSHDDMRLRTQFRVFRLPSVPIWEDEHFDVLSDLNVAKANGGTVFKATADQWESVLAIARNEPETLLNEESSGQGFGLTAAERKVIELHAQGMAKARFEDEFKYSVKIVADSESYDLHCTKGDEVLFVEVKGTTGTGDTIFLTRNEVALSRKTPKLMALVIVRNIKLVKSGAERSATGGEMQIIKPWDVNKFEPKPIQFQCQVPKA